MEEENTSSSTNKDRNHNHTGIGPAIGIAIDDIGSDNHDSSYSNDPRKKQSNKQINNDIAFHNNGRNDISYSDSFILPYHRPTLFDMENSHKAKIADQRNFMSMAQSVRNLGFVPHMNMNFNHQQMNALNASLNAAGAMNSVNFPLLRNPMFVPDVNTSLSSTNGFSHHHNFVSESGQDHNGFAMADDNSASLHMGDNASEQFDGGQSGKTHGPLRNAATALNGHASNIKIENRRRGRGIEVGGVSNLPTTKRTRYTTQSDNVTQEEQQSIPPSLEQYINTPGRSHSLYTATDERNLSQYQCLARKQMEIFEASLEDAGNNAQGRNRPILPGQIGIRCRHCYKLPAKQRNTGSIYYPNRLEGVYQTAQKMTVGHLCKHCTMVPEEIRERLLFLKDQKSSDGGGKRYWAKCVHSLGVIETPCDGLVFAKPLPEKRENNSTELL